MSTTAAKENNKNTRNTNGNTAQKDKRFMGGNSSLQGKDLWDKSTGKNIWDNIKRCSITDYVGQEYTHGGDIRYMIKNMANFVRSQDPPANANQFEVESWKK